MSDNELVSGAPQETFQTIFENANDAIFIVDIENDSIVDCNPAATDLVGYSREEILSMPAANLHPHNLSEFIDFAETVFERGYSSTDEITCYHKAGNIIPAEMSASVVEIDGRDHLVNVIRDTSDREERDWFEALIRHSQDLITVITPDGTIQYQSPSASHVIGYEAGELREENFFAFVHPDDRDSLRDVFESLAENAVTERREYRFRRADGSWAWFESIGSHRPDSAVSGYIVNSRDITAWKESQQQAAVLNRVIRHNLRNELSVVIGIAEQIVATHDGEVATHADRILDRAWKLQEAASYTDVLTDILESHHIQFRTYDITKKVKRLVTQLGTEWPDTTFELDLPEKQHVTGTPKLDVALEHVLQNAVKHNDSDSPRVAVSVRSPASDAGYVEVTVADNGPGIPEQEQTVLLEGRETPLEHGSGLGLWIVNWIVNRSGGRIAFEDNEPRGSRVTLALTPAESE